MSLKGPRHCAAFMIFMDQSAFETRFRENHPDKSFMEMLEAADAEWKAMSDADKAPDVQADLKRLDKYRKMMEEYKKKTGRKLSVKRPKMPKGHHRSCSAFSVFWEKLGNTEKPSDIKSDIEWYEASTAEWKAMSDADKAPYVEEHEKRIKEYEKNMEDFRKKLGEYTNNLRAYYDMKEAAGEPISDEDLDDVLIP